MDTKPFKLYFMHESWDAPFSDKQAMNVFVLEIECPREVYRLAVWTEAHLASLRERDQASDTHLGGQYIIPPDLIVARHDLDLITHVVADLIATNGLRESWRVPDELTASWVEDDIDSDDLDELDDTWQVRPVLENSCGCGHHQISTQCG